MRARRSSETLLVLQEYRQNLNGLEGAPRRVGDLHQHSWPSINEPNDQRRSTAVTFHNSSVLLFVVNVTVGSL